MSRLLALCVGTLRAGIVGLNLLAGTAVAATATWVVADPAHAQEMSSSQGALIRSLLPAVVNVTVHKQSPSPTAPKEASAGDTPNNHKEFGSGFLVDPSGIIMTNYHVVDGAWDIVVGFSDGERTVAHLLNASRLVDIALLKVDTGHPLPVVKWGDSDALQVGDPVFAIGNPFGVGTSVTSGIVSALNRNIMDSPYDDFIQTDAAINHGSSGGPLFNLRGEVVGVDTALISPTTASTGLGFAIPAHSAQIIMNRLTHYGWLRPGWIGVKIQQVTDDAANALGMPRAQGSIVSNVTPGGPAEKAGLRIGDVIMTLGASSPGDERALLRQIATAPIGEPLQVGLWRDGRQQTIAIPVMQWPRDRWEVLDPRVSLPVVHEEVPADLGITLTPLNAANRAQYDVKDMPPGFADGVLVSNVATGTDASARGLKAGDVILRVQERTVKDTHDVQQAFDTARADKKDFVLVLVLPKDADKPGPEWLSLRVGYF